MATSVEYFDYGAPVDVKAPPVDEVVELSDHQDWRCRPDQARPISVSRTIEALERRGFELEHRDDACSPGLAASLTNTGGSMFSLWSVPSLADGVLSCDVLATESGVGEIGIYLGYWTTDPPGFVEPVERTLANIGCALFVQGPKADERIDALDAAFAELRREVGG